MTFTNGEIMLYANLEVFFLLKLCNLDGFKWVCLNGVHYFVIKHFIALECVFLVYFYIYQHLYLFIFYP